MECAPASLAHGGMNGFLYPIRCSGWGTVGVGKRTPQCENVTDTINYLIFFYLGGLVLLSMILAQRYSQFLVTFKKIFCCLPIIAD